MTSAVEATSGQTLFFHFEQRLPSPFPHLASQNPSSLVTHPHLRMIPFGWCGDFDHDHQAMSDQELPLSPDKRMESAEMDLRLSVDPACAHTMEDVEFAECASGTPEALCSAVEQAGNCQGHIEVDDVAAVYSRDSSRTVDYTRNDAAGTVVDPGTGSFVQQRAPNGIEDYTEDLEAQTTSIPNPANMAVGPTPGTVNVRERSRSPRRLEEMGR